MHSEEIKHHFQEVLECNYSDYELRRLNEAFDIFMSPSEDGWSVVGKIHDKSRLSKAKRARETIAELLEGDAAREDVLRVIDTAIFWKEHSAKDIRLHFKERCEEHLGTAFSQTETKYILTQFNELKAKLEFS